MSDENKWKRDDQINALMQLIIADKRIWANYGMEANRLYDKGVRILADGEEVGKRLSDDDIRSLSIGYDFESYKITCLKVQAEIFGDKP